MAYIDPTDSSPANYKTIFEDDGVRVLEMTLSAGESDNEHSHPEMTAYFTSGGRVRVYEDGEATEMDIADGFVMHHAEWTHRVENIGDTDIHGVIFEPK